MNFTPSEPWRYVRCEGTKAKIPVNKHNIWDSPKAAAKVRSIANGNETVPTVVIGPNNLLNPSIKQVQAALDGQPLTELDSLGFLATTK